MTSKLYGQEAIPVRKLDRMLFGLAFLQLLMTARKFRGIDMSTRMHARVAEQGGIYFVYTQESHSQSRAASPMQQASASVKVPLACSSVKLYTYPHIDQ